MNTSSEHRKSVSHLLRVVVSTAIVVGIAGLAAAQVVNTPGWNYGRVNCSPPSITTARGCRACCEAGAGIGTLDIGEVTNCKSFCGGVVWEVHWDNLPLWKRLISPSPYDPENA